MSEIYINELTKVKCNRCRIKLPVSDYTERSEGVLLKSCDSCRIKRKVYTKRYYNKDYRREYYEKNKESIMEKHKLYYEKNKKAIIEYNKQYYQRRKIIVEEYYKNKK